jgi:preprotein translocase SecE subunit
VKEFYIKLALVSLGIAATFGFVWKVGWLGRFSNYVLGTREELKKCTWPTRPELWQTTVIIFIITAFLGLFTVGSDFVWLKVIRQML